MDRQRIAAVVEALADVGYGSLSTSELYSHADADTTAMLIEEFGRFAAEVIAPTDRSGDTAGCQFDIGTASVITSPGSPEAYSQFVDAGWGSVAVPAEHGGGGFPKVVGTALQELFASANVALSLCPTLTQSAIELLSEWGSADQRERYLTKLVTGEWTGTMLLTEPEAGSDVGAVRTTATPLDDGRWALSGTKIFITFGEHDMAGNIVHLALARTPGAPGGTKGLSLFLVPKFEVDADGALTDERNTVWCRSIEHKVGIHGSPTCVMELDGAVGELVGEVGGGMRAMFSMMNPARLAIGLQGLGIGDTAYREAAAFAAERRQGSIRGVEGAVSIDQHPDVIRMLESMRVALEAMRLVVYRTAIESDRAAIASDATERERAQHYADLFTPIAKAWVSDLGVEISSTAIQVFGGVGYCEDTRAPQRWRDSRIAPIYEGTNGIQAIDLIARKLPLADGTVSKALLAEIDATAASLSSGADADVAIGRWLAAASAAVSDAVASLASDLGGDRNRALGAATEFLGVFGDLVGGWLLCQRVLERREQGREGSSDVRDATLFCAQRVSTIPARCDAAFAFADALR